MPYLVLGSFWGWIRMPGPRSLSGRGGMPVTIPWKVHPQCWHLVVATEAGGMHHTGFFLVVLCFGRYLHKFKPNLIGDKMKTIKHLQKL